MKIFNSHEVNMPVIDSTGNINDKDFRAIMTGNSTGVNFAQFR